MSNLMAAAVKRRVPLDIAQELLSNHKIPELLHKMNVSDEVARSILRREAALYLKQTAKSSPPPKSNKDAYDAFWKARKEHNLAWKESVGNLTEVWMEKFKELKK